MANGRVFPSGPDGVSIRPYIKASALFLEEQYYQGIAGAGAELDIPIKSRWSVGLDGYWQYAAFTSSAERPSAEDLDGQEARFSADITYNADTYGLTFSGEAASVLASQNYESYQEFGARVFGWASLSAPVDFTSPRIPSAFL